MKNKLGLFGGRFDPIHRTHISIAQAVLEQLSLNEIKWIPTGVPVQKKVFASAKHRLKMLELALDELSDKRMTIDDREIKVSKINKPSFSYKTIQSLKIEFPKTDFFWILGEDQLLNFRTWKNWKWLLENIKLVLCHRGYENSQENISTAESLKEKQTLRINGAKIIEINFSADSCSSTKIRKLIYSKKKVDEYISNSVENYIIRNKLYQKEKGEKNNFKS